jgi:DNA-binding GntR family transcriptional regulator
MCWTDVYADAAYAEVIDLARGHPDALVAALIERHFGRRIDVVDQQVRAVLLPDAVAAKLEATAGEPGLKITRHYRDEQGKLVVVSETIHPDDRFTLVMQMKRETP